MSTYLINIYAITVRQYFSTNFKYLLKYYADPYFYTNGAHFSPQFFFERPIYLSQLSRTRQKFRPFKHMCNKPSIYRKSYRLVKRNKGTSENRLYSHSLPSAHRQATVVTKNSVGKKIRSFQEQTDLQGLQPVYS